MHSLEEENKWLDIYERNDLNIKKTCKQTGISIEYIYKIMNEDKIDKYILEHKDNTFEEAMLYRIRRALKHYIKASEDE